MITNNTTSCDKCGRGIPPHKGYISIDGWIICGICQYEGNTKPEFKYFNEEWNTEKD